MDTTLDMQRIFRIRNTYFTVFVVEQDTRRVEHQFFCLFGISQGTDLEYGTSAGDVGANHITITRRCTLKKKFSVVKTQFVYLNYLLSGQTGTHESSSRVLA